MRGRITVRPVVLDDMPFLCRVYASTREEELMQVPWTATQKESFLQMQFEAQHRHYMEHYRDAAFGVILDDGVPVGRLYIARWPEEIRIVDISLLPEHRRRGIGSFLLRQILDEATATTRRVGIHVERFNPALHLYERLGFRAVADRGVYLFLEWVPGETQVKTAS